MRQVSLPGAIGSTTSLGFGCAHLAGGFETSNNVGLVLAAYDSGIRHFDVAPLYGWGSAENVLSQALRDKRQSVTLATKVGIGRPTNTRIQSLIRASTTPIKNALRRYRTPRPTEQSPQSASSTDFSPVAVSASLNESLRRLQTDYVDLLLLHEVRISDLTDELLAVLDKLRQHGAFRALGLATDPADINEIAQLHPGIFDVFQCPWSVLDWRQKLPSGARFIVTHRALLRAFVPLKIWLHADSAARSRIEIATAQDLKDDRILSRLLIGAALAANSTGIVLVSSRRKKRVIENSGVAQDDRIIAAGAKLAEALRQEPSCPFPI
jgi:aryl-alcohol dehydrogenase-like predicted oxidoreductase